MNYVLYTAEDCHDCAEVLESYHRLKLDFQVTNYDLDDISQAELALYAFPALCEGDKILAYGLDIIPYLERKAS
jgi:glutaredoxin-related protein